MSRADIIGKVAAPGGADAAGQTEAVILDLIQTRAGHHAADLGLFSEYQQVGQHTEMFAAPVFARNAYAALHLIKNEQHIIFVAKSPKLLQEFAAEMVVPAFTLDRLDDN